MALRNHCDVCQQLLPGHFLIVGLGTEHTPTRLEISRGNWGDGAIRSAEICSADCATRWVEQTWATLSIPVEAMENR